MRALRALLSRSRAALSLCLSLNPPAPGGQCPSGPLYSLSLSLSFSLSVSREAKESLQPLQPPRPRLRHLHCCTALLLRILKEKKGMISRSSSIKFGVRLIAMSMPAGVAISEFCVDFYSCTGKDMDNHTRRMLRVEGTHARVGGHAVTAGGGGGGVSPHASEPGPDTTVRRPRSPVSTPPAQSSTRAPTRSPPPLSPPSAPLWSVASLLMAQLPAAAAVSSGRCWVRAGGVVVACALL